MTKLSRVAIVVVGLAGSTGLVAAQPKADAKAPPAGAGKPADAKPADAKPPAEKPAMPDMKPPAALADMAKVAAGNYTCKGQGRNMTNQMVDMSGTMKLRTELDGWWMHASFDAKMGKEPFKFESYSTFDAQANKWKRVMVMIGGGWASGESAGLKDGKVDWDITMRGPMGEMMFRDHEDTTDLKTGVKSSGEASMDKGKTWMPTYTMTCKKA